MRLIARCVLVEVWWCCVMCFGDDPFDLSRVFVPLLLNEMRKYSPHARKKKDNTKIKDQ